MCLGVLQGFDSEAKETAKLTQDFRGEIDFPLFTAQQSAGVKFELKPWFPVLFSVIMVSPSVISCVSYDTGKRSL